MALIAGLVSVFLSRLPYVSLMLGAAAILIAVRAVRQRDNEYGPVSGICGVMGIAATLYVMVLFSPFA